MSIYIPCEECGWHHDYGTPCKTTSVSAVASNGSAPLQSEVSGADYMRQARLLDEVVFKGNDYAGDRTVRDGIITLLSKKGLQVQIKVAVGQRPEQTFVKWDKVLELRKTH